MVENKLYFILYHWIVILTEKRTFKITLQQYRTFK